MFLFGFSLTAVSSLLGALCMAILAGIMLALGTKRVHFIWGIFSFAVFIYAAGFYMVATVHDPANAQYWWKVEYIGTILIPFIFFHFVLEFIGKVRAWIVSLCYILAAVFLYFDVTTNLIINQVTFMFGELYYNYPPGILHPYLMATYAVLILVAHYLLYKSYRTSADPLYRLQVRNVMIATGIGFIGGVLNFFPVYGIDVYPATNLTVVFGSVFIGFTILRYHLFNVKVVTAQLLTLVLAASTLARLVMSSSIGEGIFNAILLGITLVVGVFLIRSVRNEVEQRERIELLARDLQVANDRLKELDKQKTEFVSFATHQLRAPLTAMKGYASLIVEGDLGKVSSDALQASERIYESAKTLSSIVDDYLNVSRIELGTMKYDFEPLDMNKLAEEVVGELKPNIQKSGLDFSYAAIGEGPWTVSADPDKFKQVVANVIDNSVKYTPKGFVRVTLERVPNADGTIPVRMTVSDSGIGIAPGVMPKLFQKFSRAEGANKQNIHGTGLGLFIVREIVTAHHGKVWAESPGEGKGSKFIVEMPVA